MSSSRRSSRGARPKMVGTVLPQDSMRGMRSNRLSLPPQSLPPPPPSTASTVSREETAIKLLAAAGRDLFRHGLAFDGIFPTRQEPRHPAVTPNLSSIPEDDAIEARQRADDSQLIVITGGPLNNRGEPGVWVSNRIAKAIQLYWQIRLTIDEQEEREEAEETTARMCYIAPTGGESSDDGVVETEAIRNALVVTGVSPHHILMDCTSTSLVENAVQVAMIARQLRVRRIHVVTSAFHVPRTRMCFDAILRAARDLSVELAYHSAPDGLTPSERTERASAEQVLAATARSELDNAVKHLQAKGTRVKGRNSVQRPVVRSDV